MCNSDKSTVNRQRIIEAANTLFYQRGYSHTSFSDIVEAAGVRRGNIYYYFKTKDDILAAVITERLEAIRDMFETWEQEYTDPADRLKCFGQMMLRSSRDILQYGCPFGTLNSELGKGEWALRNKARALFDSFRRFLTRQFGLLGYEDRADELALHMMVRGQGMGILTHVYENADIIEREVEELMDWLDKLKHGRRKH